MALRRRLGLAAALVLWLTGCSSGSGPDGGTATDGATSDGGAVVEIGWLAEGQPDIAPPALAPCPAGWVEVAPSGGRDARSCEPLGPAGAEVCAEDEAHFVGTAGCERLGPACPADGLVDASGLPSDQPAVHVLASASGVGADGSRARPYRTLGDFAWGGLGAGMVVALGVGTYEGVVRLPGREVTLWGACVLDTVLRSAEPHDLEGVLHASRGPGHARQLTVADSERAGVVVSGAGELSLDDVVVRGVRGHGILVWQAGQLRATRLAVRDTRATVGGTFGRGLGVESGSSAEVTRALFERNRDTGAYASAAGTSLTLEDVVVRDTQSRDSDGMSGRGLGVESGASADVSRALFERNRDVGVFATEAGTHLTLEDVVVRDTQGRERDGTGGRGLGVLLGASATVSRALFERNRELGVFASEAGTSVAFEDVVVRDTQSQQSDGMSGRGLQVQLGASAVVSRALFERNREAGVDAIEAGTHVTLEDVVVRDTQSQQSDGMFGLGLGVQLGASATVSRALFERNREVGVDASEAGTRVTLEDVVVRDTQSRENNGTFGRGLNVQTGASAEVSRALVERNRGLGVFASNADTRVTLEDLVVRDTQSRESDGTGGRGLNVQLGAAATGHRVLIDRSHQFGLTALYGATVALSDVVVMDTREQQCAASSCMDTPAGTAAISYGEASFAEASLSLERFVVDDAALCGVHVAGTARLDLIEGEVRGCGIGACVQVDGYDSRRLTDQVRYLDNAANLQATNLPVPELSEPIPDT